MNLESLLDSLMAGRCGDDSEDEGSDQADRERGKMLVTVSADETVRDDVRGLVCARAHQEVRFMELDFQPRKRFRLWEAIWQQIAVMVHRYYGSGTIHSAAEGKVDLSLKSTRDPEIGLSKPDVSFTLNLAPEAAAKRGGRRVAEIKTTLQKSTREKTYAIDGTSDNSDTPVEAVDTGAVDAGTGDEGSEKE